MARYVMRVRTEKPAEEVFDFMADLSNFPEWDPGTKSAKQEAGDGPGEGAEYELEASGATLRYVVTAYDPPRKVVARAQNRFVTRSTPSPSRARARAASSPTTPTSPSTGRSKWATRC